MEKGKYKDFAHRLIESLKSNGYLASRSPRGICIQTLAKLTSASEQICRRYIRGDALPDYEKIVTLSHHLKVSPGWLLFGDQSPSAVNNSTVQEGLLHYIIKSTHNLYRVDHCNPDDYPDFVLSLIREIREIDTTLDNLKRIVDLAVNSFTSYDQIRIKKQLSIAE